MADTYYIDDNGTLYKTLNTGNILNLDTSSLLVKFIVGPVTDSFLLMETGDFLLMESGDKIILDGI